MGIPENFRLPKNISKAKTPTFANSSMRMTGVLFRRPPKLPRPMPGRPKVDILIELEVLDENLPKKLYIVFEINRTGTPDALFQNSSTKSKQVRFQLGCRFSDFRCRVLKQDDRQL